MSCPERRFTVRWSDVDANGHMRHTSFLEFGAEVRIALFLECGFTWKRFEEAGIGPVLLREEIDYLSLAAGTRWRRRSASSTLPRPSRER